MCTCETLVLRGTESYHMEAYLMARGYARSAPDSFVAPGICVRVVSSKQVPLGSIRLTEVTLTFEGDQKIVKREMERMRLQFMTAGG